MNRPVTYDEIKDLLEAKHEVLLQKIAEVKEDTMETKIHAKETNGNVAANLERIHRLEVEQNEDNKFRKGFYWVFGSVATLLIVDIMLKFIL